MTILLGIMIISTTPFISAMEGDGKQDQPCKDIRNIEERVDCRINMVEHRIDMIQKQGCRGLTAEDCQTVKDIHAEQIIDLEHIKDLLNYIKQTDDLKSKRLIVATEIKPMIHEMHERCDQIEEIRNP